MLLAAYARARAPHGLELLLWAALQISRWERARAGKRRTMPAAEKKKLVQTDGELGLTMDPSLLRGATADLLIKNRSEIFSSNVLSQKDLAQLHESTAIVSFLDSFFSHSWRTARLDKWAGLLLYLNAQAAALAMVAGTVFWTLLEDFGVVPRLLVFYMADRHMMSTGMPILVGYASGITFLINWQRIRKCFGLGPRYCFLDKVCIDQVDDARKAAGIASLGAFLGSAENFVVLFSPDYFSRLWCVYELAAFRHLQVAGKQKITFLPLAFPRVLFANAVAIAVACLPYAIIPIIGPWLGIDTNAVTTGFLNWGCLPGAVLCMWTMYECQRYVDARVMIDEQLDNFSVTKTECYDEKIARGSSAKSRGGLATETATRAFANLTSMSKRTSASSSRTWSENANRSARAYRGSTSSSRPLARSWWTLLCLLLVTPNRPGRIGCTPSLKVRLAFWSARRWSRWCSSGAHRSNADLGGKRR